MNSFAILFLFFQGCAAFTAPAVKSRRTSFVSKPFFVATELKSEDTPAEEATENIAPAVAEAADEVVAEAADEVVAEAVDEAIAVISDEKRVLRERHTVFLGNLPFDLTKDEIAELGSQYGDVKQVSVPLNKQTALPRGFAFVDYASSEEAESAISTLDGFLFKGRNIRASISDPTQKKVKKEDDGVAKIYVGNIPFTTTREELLEYYKGFVDAVEAYIPVNADTGAGRGFAFITVKSEEVQSAIDQTNGLEYEGRPLVVNLPLPPGQRKERRPSIKERTKLYIGNLAFTTDVEILIEVFGEFGDVLDCYMPEDPVRGGSRGFGFVTMARDNALEAVNELDGCELDGRFIRVNEAMPKGQAPPKEDNEEEAGFEGDAEL